MLAAIVFFFLNGLYQRMSWWDKGGKDTATVYDGIYDLGDLAHTAAKPGAMQVSGVCFV